MMQKKEQTLYFALQGKYRQDNIFVTKKKFFRNEDQKIFLHHTFLVDLVGWQQTNIFLSLTLLHLSKFIQIISILMLCFQGYHHHHTCFIVCFPCLLMVDGKGVVIRIRMFMIQTPLGAQQGLGTQPQFETPCDLWVENLKMQ